MLQSAWLARPARKKAASDQLTIGDVSILQLSRALPEITGNPIRTTSPLSKRFLNDDLLSQTPRPWIRRERNERHSLSEHL